MNKYIFGHILCIIRHVYEIYACLCMFIYINLYIFMHEKFFIGIELKIIERVS